MAPLVADGVVITGISGAEYGIRGFIDGWDPETGKHLWRTYTVAGPGDPEAKSWPGDTWQHGGGSTWITGSFDPELHTVYWGTGNAGSWNPTQHPGDNLYTCSVLALDPKTGKMKWHFQFSPNDPYDYDSVAEMVLANLNIGGNPTKALMDVNRNGFMYVLDRTDGKLIAANQYITEADLGKGHRRERTANPHRNYRRGAEGEGSRRLARRDGRQELEPGFIRSGNRPDLC